MLDSRLGGMRLACLLVLSAIVLLPGLGSSSRLTYHEAFVAQGAREILDSANWAYPTIGGLPWLEKPPLPWWLVAALGHCTGEVDETIARLPSSLAAIGLVLGVAVLAARHYGPGIGLLAGSIQATTAWTVTRGRLAEADILLACLVTWTIVAFDRLIVHGAVQGTRPRVDVSAERWRLWRWVFFTLLGIIGLVKGIGFGAVLILSVVATLLLCRRDWSLTATPVPTSGMGIDSGNYALVANVDGGAARLRSANALDNACVRSVIAPPGPWSICQRAMVGVWAKRRLSGSPLVALGSPCSLAVSSFILASQTGDRTE